MCVLIIIERRGDDKEGARGKSGRNFHHPCGVTSQLCRHITQRGGGLFTLMEEYRLPVKPVKPVKLDESVFVAALGFRTTRLAW